MKARKIVSGATVVALALAGVLITGGGASAEEEVTPPVEAPVTEVVEVPAEPVVEPVVERVLSEPVVEPVPEPVAEPVVEVQPEVKEEPVPVQEDKGQPEFICDESGAGWQAKVDWDGDGNPTVTAPAGFLIDSYCVKAGTTEHIIEVNPPSASVVIDHPIKDSVSHYQIHLVPVPDQPKVVLFTPPLWEDPCGPNNVTFNLPDIEGTGTR